MIETPEQQKLRADLIAQYGELTFARALQLAGLQMCLIALGADGLTAEERARLVRQSGIHLAELMDTAVPAAESAKIVECARRIDAAVDLWMVDELEQQEGLPPSEATNPHWLARGGPDGPGFTLASNTFMEEMRRQWERLRKGNG